MLLQELGQEIEQILQCFNTLEDVGGLRKIKHNNLEITLTIIASFFPMYI